MNNNQNHQNDYLKQEKLPGIHERTHEEAGNLASPHNINHQNQIPQNVNNNIPQQQNPNNNFNNNQFPQNQ